MLVRKAAGALNLVLGAWIGFNAYQVTHPCVPYDSTGLCTFPAVTHIYWGVLALGVLLLVDAAACFIDKWLAFPVGAIFAVVVIPVVAVQYGTGQYGALGPERFAISVAIALVALAVNVRAAFSKPEVPEENHPLNLPVFG